MAPPSASSAPSDYPSMSGAHPVCRYVNVELHGVTPGAGVRGTKGTVLLENPQGDFPISLDELRHQVP